MKSNLSWASAFIIAKLAKLRQPNTLRVEAWPTKTKQTLFWLILKITAGTIRDSDPKMTEQIKLAFAQILS